MYNHIFKAISFMFNTAVICPGQSLTGKNGQIALTTLNTTSDLISECCIVHLPPLGSSMYREWFPQSRWNRVIVPRCAEGLNVNTDTVIIWYWCLSNFKWQWCFSGSVTSRVVDWDADDEVTTFLKAVCHWLHVHPHEKNVCSKHQRCADPKGFHYSEDRCHVCIQVG